MKVKIDFSVFYSPDAAYGSVSGQLELCALPAPGDKLSLMLPSAAGAPDVLLESAIVEWRRFGVGGEANCLIGLADIMAGDSQQAEAVMRYVESELGLWAHRYHDE